MSNMRLIDGIVGGLKVVGGGWSAGEPLKMVMLLMMMMLML